MEDGARERVSLVVANRSEDIGPGSYGGSGLYNAHIGGRVVFPHPPSMRPFIVPCPDLGRGVLGVVTKPLPRLETARACGPGPA